MQCPEITVFQVDFKAFFSTFEESALKLPLVDAARYCFL
jgi:hypothetical protein